jgi:hypothetical protein
LIPGRCSSIFGIWREVLGCNVYIISQYFFPAIIYRDIISHITSTYRDIMYFFRPFKKSTVRYKVHNMGLRYIKLIIAPVETLYCKRPTPGGEGGGESIFWKTRDIGLPSYSNNLSTIAQFFSFRIALYLTLCLRTTLRRKKMFIYIKINIKEFLPVVNNFFFFSKRKKPQHNSHTL